MTDRRAVSGAAQRVHRACTECAPAARALLAIGATLCLAATMVQAGDAWDMFVDRCLDPFEHQSLAVIDGLQAQPVDQMHDARRVFGPTAEGYLLVLDAAPSEGERACGVEFAGAENSMAATDWLKAQKETGRYEPSDASWLVSNEWIEPKVMVRAEVSDVRTIYEIVETDLES